MDSRMQLGDVEVLVRFKDIKNLHLSTHPPTGRVTISAPLRTATEAIRLFAISKLPWIHRQQKKLDSQDRETPREVIERESHYLWGRRYLLRLNETTGTPNVQVSPRYLDLAVRQKSKTEEKSKVLEAWYRDQLREKATPLVRKWEAVLGVSLNKLLVRRMKTRWGSCNAQSANICLNTDLAKKPPECLEYILVHEMVHLRHPNHGPEFRRLLGECLAGWKSARKLLNSLPVKHEDWTY